MEIWPVQTSTVTVTRPNYDGLGNRYDSLGDPIPSQDATKGTFTLQAVVSLQPAMSRPRLGEGQENRFIQDAAIFIKRGTTGPNGIPALQAGDEVQYNGEDFTIAGDARGNQPHPLTGADLGWMGFRMQGVG